LRSVLRANTNTNQRYADMPIPRLLIAAAIGLTTAAFGLVTLPSAANAQSPAANANTAAPSAYGEMHWRGIGPTRGGRARALDGVPSQPNVFYAGFDNGGVWRSTDYGAN
jgi:hypothetical protein